MFQFHYALTDDDYIKFNFNHALYTKTGKQTTHATKLLVPCSLVLALLILPIHHDFQLLMIELITFSIISILWIVFFKKIVLYNIKKSVCRTKKSGRLPYTENGTLTFDENFICDQAQTQENKTSYSLVEAIYTTNEAVYIYINAMSAIILPYRFIENQTVFNNFINFLQEKTGKLIINITK